MRAVTAEEVLALAKRADMTGHKTLATNLYASAWREFDIGTVVDCPDTRGPNTREQAAAAARYADRFMLTEVF